MSDERFNEDEAAFHYANERKNNNPHNEPVGHYTGRCKRCGSDDLWDDNLAYGCNTCHAFWSFNQ